MMMLSTKDGLPCVSMSEPSERPETKTYKKRVNKFHINKVNAVYRQF